MVILLSVSGRWCCFQTSLFQFQPSAILFVFRTIPLTAVPFWGFLPYAQSGYHSFTTISLGSALHSAVVSLLIWLLLTSRNSLLLRSTFATLARPPRIMTQSSSLISAIFTLHDSVQLSGFDFNCNLTLMPCLI